MINFIRDWINRTFSDPQVIILAILLIFGFLLIFTLGSMLAPVFASLVLAYLLDDMVSLFQKLKIPRSVSVLIVFVFFMACLLFLFIGLLPMLSRQIGQLFQDLPTMITNGQDKIVQLAKRHPDIFSQQQINQLLGALSSEISGLGQGIVSFSVSSVKSLISFIIYLILVPLLVFFFLKDKFKILQWMKNILPKNRALATEVWQEVNQQISNYIRGKAWEIIIVWIASYITFTILGLRYSVLVSLFVGLSVLIPYIGATVMTLPIALIAFFQWGWGSEFAYVLISYGILQLLDGNLLAPLLLSEVVNLHPIAIIVAVLVFGGLWGIWGLIFAIPLATLVQAVINAILSKRDNKPEKEVTERNPA